MRPIVVIIIFLLIVTLLAIFAIKVYNSLVILKNKTEADWQQLHHEIKFRVDLLNQYLSLVKEIVSKDTLNGANNIMNKLRVQMSWEDIMNSYIELEYIIETIKIEQEDKNVYYPEWEEAFIVSKNRLDKARDIYNDDVLGMNNKVDLFPFSIVAGICGFEKYIYFRNEN